jgi:hypothetical protein
MNGCILIYFRLFESFMCNYINKYSELIGDYMNVITQTHGTQNIKVAVLL